MYRHPGTVAQVAPPTDVGDQIDRMCRLLETSQQRSDEAIKTLTEAHARLEAEIAELQKANEAIRRAQDKENLHLERTEALIV